MMEVRTKESMRPSHTPRTDDSGRYVTMIMMTTKRRHFLMLIVGMTLTLVIIGAELYAAGPSRRPKTVDKAVKIILEEIGDDARELFRKMEKKDLERLRKNGFAVNLGRHFGLIAPEAGEDKLVKIGNNSALLKDTDKADAIDATMVITEAAWKELQKTPKHNKDGHDPAAAGHGQ